MTWALGHRRNSGPRACARCSAPCAKSLHPGRAAQNGLAVRTFWRPQNFTSSDRAIEAPRGFAQECSAREWNYLRHHQRSRCKTFEISQNTYKPFPCGVVIHPVIDGCIQMRKENLLEGAHIEAITLRVHPLVLELTGKNGLRAGWKGSSACITPPRSHSSAELRERGRVFGDAEVRDPEIVSVRDRVMAAADPSVREDEAHLSIQLRDGRRLEKHVEHAIGGGFHRADDRP